jgi:hypothetical protein
MGACSWRGEAKLLSGNHCTNPVNALANMRRISKAGVQLIVDRKDLLA